MVRITNGKETMEVSKGAFKALFERYGWRLEDQNIDDLSVDNSSNDTLSENVEKDGENENLTPQGDEEDEEEDDEYEDEPEDEVEIPFSEMTVRQLQDYADEHDIDVSEANNKKELRKIILESLKEE